MKNIIMKHFVLPSLIAAATLILVRGNVQSQVYTASLCEKAGNADLPSLIKKGSIGELTWFGNMHIGSYVCDWSTSYLKATGKGPVPPAGTGDGDADDASYDYELAREKWSCMYSAWGAMDGSTATAWCEGKKDEGIGEILIVKADVSKPVRIWNGLGASETLYRANNRPQKIRVTVLQAKRASMVIGQYTEGIEYSDITALGSHEITLKDLNGWQPLPVPPHERLAFKSISEHGEPAVKNEDSTFIAVEILSVYKGTKYNDTCISEIGGEGKGK